MKGTSRKIADENLYHFGLVVSGQWSVVSGIFLPLLSHHLSPVTCYKTVVVYLLSNLSVSSIVSIAST